MLFNNHIYQMNKKLINKIKKNNNINIRTFVGPSLTQNNIHGFFKVCKVFFSSKDIIDIEKKRSGLVSKEKEERQEKLEIYWDDRLIREEIEKIITEEEQDPEAIETPQEIQYKQWKKWRESILDPEDLSILHYHKVATEIIGDFIWYDREDSRWTFLNGILFLGYLTQWVWIKGHLFVIGLPVLSGLFCRFIYWIFPDPQWISIYQNSVTYFTYVVPILYLIHSVTCLLLAIQILWQRDRFKRIFNLVCVGTWDFKDEAYLGIGYRIVNPRNIRVIHYVMIFILLVAPILELICAYFIMTSPIFEFKWHAYVDAWNWTTETFWWQKGWAAFDPRVMVYTPHQ